MLVFLPDIQQGKLQRIVEDERKCKDIKFGTFEISMKNMNLLPNQYFTLILLQIFYCIFLLVFLIRMSVNLQKLLKTFLIAFRITIIISIDCQTL